MKDDERNYYLKKGAAYFAHEEDEGLIRWGSGPDGAVIFTRPYAHILRRALPGTRVVVARKLKRRPVKHLPRFG